MLFRLGLIFYFFVVFALLKSFYLIRLMTDYDSILVVVVKEGLAFIEMFYIAVCLISISLMYLYSSNVVYDRRTKA
jgi:hypothetical protein